MTAEDNITTKKYNINVYKRTVSEDIEYEKQEQERIEEANAVLQKINTENVVDPDEDITLVDEEVIQKEEAENNNKVVSNVLMIVGLVLSVIVIGIVVLRVRNKI